QALGMLRRNDLAVPGDCPIANPVGVAREACGLLILYVHLEKANRRFVLGIIDNFGIIFPFFLSLFVSAGIFLCTKNNGFFVKPTDLTGCADQVRERIRLAAVRTYQPDLRAGSVWLGFRARLVAEEGDPFAVRRPGEGGIAVRSARKLNFASFRKAGKIDVRYPRIFLFVASREHPGEPFTVRGNPELLDRFGLDDVFGCPGLGFWS